MEASTAQACKYILLTFEDGKTNHYYDSTFRLRPPFKPNANGQYSITINECLFMNNEPTLAKGDWFEIESTYSDGTKYIDRYTIKYDVFTQTEKDDIKIVSVLTGQNTYLDESGDGRVSEIKLYDEEDNQYSTNPDTYRYQMKPSAIMKVKFIDNANVTKAVMRWNTNFCYLLNNLRASDYDSTIEGTGADKTFNFPFYNLRRGGAYLYVLKTPLQTPVPTYNANNQGYNVVACVYNTLAFHNQPVQMCSSMQVVSNDLSNLRIELVNDQYETLKIRGPVYIQLTVSNE